MGVHLLKTRTDRGPQEVRRCCKVSQCEVGLGLKDCSLHMALMLEPDIISSLKYVWPEKGDSSISLKQLNFKYAEAMLIIAMKSNLLQILTACVLSNVCWWVIYIFVSSVQSLLVVLFSAHVLNFFKSALVLIYTFKDCLLQVNPGHMNIFMKKNPQVSTIWFVCLVQSLLINSHSCLVGFQVHFRQQCLAPFTQRVDFGKQTENCQSAFCVKENTSRDWRYHGYHDYFTGCFEGSSMFPTKKICANCKWSSDQEASRCLRWSRDRSPV